VPNDAPVSLQLPVRSSCDVYEVRFDDGTVAMVPEAELVRPSAIRVAPAAGAAR